MLTVMDPRVMAFTQLIVHPVVHNRKFLLSCF